MVTLHRLGRVPAPFDLNEDLIVTVEACPDTVLTLATGARIVVTETPSEVAQRIRDWRASVMAGAMTSVQGASPRLRLADNPS
jgi:flagellar protein FlbD